MTIVGFFFIVWFFIISRAERSSNRTDLQCTGRTHWNVSLTAYYPDYESDNESDYLDARGKELNTLQVVDHGCQDVISLHNPVTGHDFTGCLKIRIDSFLYFFHASDNENHFSEWKFKRRQCCEKFHRKIHFRTLSMVERILWRWEWICYRKFHTELLCVHRNWTVILECKSLCRSAWYFSTNSENLAGWRNSSNWVFLNKFRCTVFSGQRSRTKFTRQGFHEAGYLCQERRRQLWRCCQQRNYRVPLIKIFYFIYFNYHV